MGTFCKYGKEPVFFSYDPRPLAPFELLVYLPEDKILGIACLEPGRWLEKNPREGGANKPEKCDETEKCKSSPAQMCGKIPPRPDPSFLFSLTLPSIVMPPFFSFRSKTSFGHGGLATPRRVVLDCRDYYRFNDAKNEREANDLLS